MFRKISILFILTAVLSVHIQAKPQSQKTKPVYAAIAVDVGSGKILYQQNADTITPPASLTKIMTLLMLFDALEQGKLRLTDMLPVSRHAASQQPCKLNLKPGGYISVQNIILSIVTKSANDAAVVAGEFLGGTESAFADYMTQRAKQFGMIHTTFKNASGLPAAGQLTTARDMAVLGLITEKHYKKYFHLFGVREFCYNNTCHVNHNYRLLSQKQLKFDGIKTGFVNASGFNVIASHQDDKGTRMIVVLMGGQTPAWRDKRVVEIVQRLKVLSPSIYVAQKTQTYPSPTPKANLVHNVTFENVASIDNSKPESVIDQPTSDPQPTESPIKYSLLLGYYGSQIRAETVAKQALAHTKLSDSKVISTKRVRIGGRYLYQASIDELSRQQVDQASAILNYFNIHSSIVEQSS
jgi:D-alanyl-D-alanine carboxypeptidase